MRKYEENSEKHEGSHAFVKFYDSEILAVIIDGIPFVAIKPICQAIGLDVQSQFEKIKSDEILSELYGEHRIVAADGKSRMMGCLPLNFVHGWLFAIELTNTMSAETRQRLTLYKRECYSVLFNHFFGKSRIIEDKQKQRFELLTEYRQLEANVSASRGRMKQIRKELETLDTDVFGQMGLFQLSEGGEHE